MMGVGASQTRLRTLLINYSPLGRLCALDNGRGTYCQLTYLPIVPLAFSGRSEVHAVFATSWPIDTRVFARKQDDLHWKCFVVRVITFHLAAVLVCRGNVVSIVR